jgi:hypothetical protein
MGNIATYIGTIASILSICYAFYSLHKIKKSIRVGFLMDVRRMIETIERDKEPFKEKEKAAYESLFRIQGELEVVYKKLLETFSIKDIRT